ncbi:MAG: hypothetical protein MUP67_10690 [Acidimicrobiia bacterium]|nr:hypothetical protein [Acidimicrobiia bacterium]
MTDEIPGIPDSSHLSDAAEEADEETWERPVDRFRKTATGSIVAAGLLGLRDVMEGRPEKEEVTIVTEAPTRPVGDLDLVIDPEHPERTVAVVRRPQPDQADRPG